MTLRRLAIFGMVLAAVFAAGVQVGHRTAAPGGEASGPATADYICPMHPQYRSNEPGACPSCGMALVAVADRDPSSHAPTAKGRAPLPPGAFAVSPVKQQTGGIKLAVVEKSAGSRTIRSIGRVAADARRLYPVTASVGGWITSAASYTAGSHVKRGAVLATFYSPEVVMGVRALLNVATSVEWAESSGEENPGRRAQIVNFTQNLQQARDALRNQGMGDAQLDRVVRARKWDDAIEVTAPADGVIVTRSIVEGQRFRSGDEFFRIADLSRVWILVDLFEQEERHLRPGRRVSVTLPRQGLTLPAVVSDVLPQFDPASRTLKVRLEAANPDYRLRPDMFVDVELPADYRPTITVPSDAVVHTGLTQVVFVDLGGGYFEPRRVTTGWWMEGRTEIVSGLAEGERVVVSGTFLLDSEARMGYAAAGITGTPARDVVCGMEVDRRQAEAAGLSSTFEGTTYLFCSDECRKAFDAEPGKYATK